MNSVIDKKDLHCFGGRLAYPGVRMQHVVWIVLVFCLLMEYSTMPTQRVPVLSGL